MKRVSLHLGAGIVLSLLVATSGSAQVARVFLAGNGNDAGDCSNAATPCRSLQGAIDQAAAGAEVVIVSSGGYGGATITKSITVNASAGVIAFVGRSIAVTIGAGDTVILRGLSMNGATFNDPSGIAFTSGGRLIVENCLIANYGTGISDQAVGSRLFVNNCDFRLSGNGINVQGGSASAAASRVAIADSRFTQNSVGGVAAYDNVSVSVRNSIAHESSTAFRLIGSTSGSSAEMTIESCQATKGSAGIDVSASANTTAVVRVSQTVIIGNDSDAIFIYGVGASAISFGNNRVAANNGNSTFSSTVALQ